MQQTKQAAVEFMLYWQSLDSRHTERFYFERVNFRRDFFPGTLGEQPAALPAGGVAGQSFANGEMFAAYDRQQNPRPQERRVDDLNRKPDPPFAEVHFDAALYTTSIEYLVQPDKVFRAVRRVLKPGAPFVITFSERWFPPKTIQLWPARDWPRPHDDQYAGQYVFADPLFAVYGRAG